MVMGKRQAKWGEQAVSFGGRPERGSLELNHLIRTLSLMDNPRQLVRTAAVKIRVLPIILTSYL